MSDLSGTRKYQNIRVGFAVNCSSTGHYSARVDYSIVARDGSVKKRKRTWFYIGTKSALPQYVQDEIFRQLRALYCDGELSIYENDRDGNARYEDLRYHEPRHFEYMIDYTPQEGRERWNQKLT
jgi:hypothetical protein